MFKSKKKYTGKEVIETLNLYYACEPATYASYLGSLRNRRKTIPSEMYPAEVTYDLTFTTVDLPKIELLGVPSYRMDEALRTLLITYEDGSQERYYDITYFSMVKQVVEKENPAYKRWKEDSHNLAIDIALEEKGVYNKNTHVVVPLELIYKLMQEG